MTKRCNLKKMYSWQIKISNSSRLTSRMKQISGVWAHKHVLQTRSGNKSHIRIWLSCAIEIALKWFKQILSGLKNNNTIVFQTQRIRSCFKQRIWWRSWGFVKHDVIVISSIVCNHMNTILLQAMLLNWLNLNFAFSWIYVSSPIERATVTAGLMWTTPVETG